MAILPRGSKLNFTGAITAQVYIDSLEYQFEVQKFDRLEFSNEKLREAKTSSGATPLIVPTFGNKPIQLAVSCTGDSPRPLVPDDANLGNIKQKFNIRRYQIKGSPSLASEVDALYGLSVTHGQYLSFFDYQLAQAGMDISYNYMVGLQANNFSYLVNSGLTMTGPALNGATETNMFISAFKAGVEYEVTLPTGQSLVLRSFEMTIEARAIMSQATVV